MPILHVPAALLATGINGFSTEGREAKAAMHSQGRAFLRKLAAALDPYIGHYTVRSNQGGTAGSGEVTLHSADLYVQIHSQRTGLSLMYRSCDSAQDCCGHTNHFVPMSEFAHQGIQSPVLSTMLRLIETEQARKVAHAQARSAAHA